MLNVQFSNYNYELSAAIAYNTGTPNWNIIPSSGMARPDENELVDEIKELADEYANISASDDKTAIRSLQNQMNVLRAQYISSVSPDRRALYNQAVAAANKNSGDSLDGTPKTLFDFLIEEDGIKTSANSDKVTEIDYNGTTVLQRSPLTGWAYEMTDAELSKLDEFSDIFDKEYESAANSIAVNSSVTDTANSSNIDISV
jgi:hypothetical protein